MSNKTKKLLNDQYIWITRDREESMGKGIAGIGVRKDVPHSIIANNTDLHACIVRIGKPWNVTVISIYVPQNADNYQLVANLRVIIDTLEPPYVICGDFNASHEVGAVHTRTQEDNNY